MDCGVAGSLRRSKYKESAYPFDWNVTLIEFIIDTFENNFENFKSLFDHCDKSGSGYLKYDNQIYFYHDQTTITNELKEKYIKRSLRLHNLLKSGKKILFVRKASDNTIKQIQKLKNIIIKKYPNLKFKILLINNIKEQSTDDDIIHVYKERECFMFYEKDNDIYRHHDSEKSLTSVLEEVTKFDSIKFKQPNKRNY